MRLGGCRAGAPTIAFGVVHHLACYSIGFLFILVISGTDSLFWLKTNNLAVWCEALGLNQLGHTLVAQHPLQLEDRGMDLAVK
jgi:hypothetical protein